MVYHDLIEVLDFILAQRFKKNNGISKKGDGFMECIRVAIIGFGGFTRAHPCGIAHLRGEKIKWI